MAKVVVIIGIVIVVIVDIIDGSMRFEKIFIRRRLLTLFSPLVYIICSRVRKNIGDKFHLTFLEILYLFRC